MKFQLLIKGKLLKRYKRFLADIELENGEIVIAHCTNTGSMKSVIEEGAPVLLSPSNNPKRKTKYTWEMIWINDAWAGVNTSNANMLAREMLENNQISGLRYLQELKAEVKYTDSRLDFFAKDKNGNQVWIEVKNVSMKEGEDALFPDAKTTRGQKHLKTLMELKKQGHRAAMIYIVQRSDVKYFGAADKIDPQYANLLAEAKAKGVEVYAIQMKLNESGIHFHKEL
jgi:sugar fermentation stimulation protein A